MEEVFVERIIKRKLSVAGLLLRMLSVLVVAFVGMLAIILLGILGFTVTVLLVYLAYLCWSYTSIEYEYSFLNGELTIDKIMGQRKRKNVDNYDIRKAEIIAKTSSDEIIRKSGNVTRRVDYSTGYQSDELYSIIINDGSGTVEVVFEPNEKMIDAMYHVRPNLIKK